VLNLALQSDQNYVDGLVATLSGVASHLPPAVHATAFVIDCGIEAATKQRLVQTLGKKFPRLSLVFLAIDTEVLARLPFPEGLRHANRSVYARIFLPELLPTTSRIVYLDCDLLIDTDISPLAGVDLQGAVVAAVVDEELKSGSTLPEFNSGVMVMDLQAMRASHLTQRAVATAGAQNTRHGDQTLLNELLRGKWSRLDPRWNRQVFLLPNFSIFRTESDTIWHIYMGRKPWHFQRKGARGLVALHYDLLDRAGWKPISQPTLSMTSPAGRDLIKQFSAKLRRGWGKWRSQLRGRRS
jgi:lipopolysaccharide biosynthesis glycosyltransferase